MGNYNHENHKQLMVHKSIKDSLDNLMGAPDMSGITTYNGVIQRLIFNSVASGSCLQSA